MWRAGGLFFIFLCSLCGKADPYNRFEEKGKVGLKDQQGNILLPASFDALGWSDGSFSVTGQITGYKLNNQWGLVNLKKQFLTKAEYNSMLYPGGDRVVVTKQINPAQIKTGCLDLTGEIKIPFEYDEITITGVRAIVLVKKEYRYNYGLRDLSNQEFIATQYKSIRPLGTLRFAIENEDGKIALFSETGKPITGFSIDSISVFKNNHAVFYQDLLQGLISRDGEIRVAPTYREIKISGDTILARMPTIWKLLDEQNHELLRIEADELIPLTQQLYAISKSRKVGVVDNQFRQVIPLEYENITLGNERQLITKRKGRYGLTRLNNSVLLPASFDTLIQQGNLVRVKEREYGNSQWAVYDTFGIRKTVKPYDWLGAYNGKFFPAISRGYFGAVNRYGQEPIRCVYDSLLDFSREQLLVKFKGLYGILNFKEEWLVKPQRYSLQLLSDDRYLQRESGMVFLKDFQGKIIYFTDNHIRFFDNYMIETLQDGTEKTIDYEGRIISRLAFLPSDKSNELFKESEGLRGFEKDGKYGFMDARGRLRIANRYEAIQSFSTGLAAVKLNHKWGFINAAEKLIIQPAYDSVTGFKNGTAIAKRNNQFGILSKEGKLLLNHRYDSIARLSSNRFLIVSQSLQGLADKDGRILIEPKYEQITDLNNNFLMVERDQKFGLLSLEGLSTIPLNYDRLIFLPETGRYLSKQIAPWKRIEL